MRLTDRLIQDTQRKQNEQKKRRIADEPDDMQIEHDPIHFMPINKQKGAFDGINNSGSSINTAESVFDRTAVFRTDSGNEEF